MLMLSGDISTIGDVGVPLPPSLSLLQEISSRDVDFVPTLWSSYVNYFLRQGEEEDHSYSETVMVARLSWVEIYRYRTCECSCD